MKLIGGDIGGTHSRLELFEARGDVLESIVAVKYDNKDYVDLDQLLEAFLSKYVKEDLTAIGLAVAGPIEQDTCRLTNLDWHIDANEMRHRFGMEQVYLLNDFEAIPYGVGHLGEQDLVVLQMGQPQPEAVRSFIGAGTGLGQAIAIQTKQSLRVLASEAGHADFAPGSRQQLDILGAMLPHGSVSNEMLMSGVGLVNIHTALNSLGVREGQALVPATEDAPRQISDLARTGDPLARHAINMFFEILGSYAGNVALQTLPRGGLYLAGGIVPKLLDLMDRDTFLDAFMHKSKMGSLLGAIPVYIIINEGVARLGAAHYACRGLAP
ncbi:MAG: glucokinase [Gammaproteobacteria bacterium]|nr:glucokinase [Gammaproteobacteria bacterium]